jgi:hypothetical protein
MISLLVLGVVLLAAWAFGIWERTGRARFMQPWVHVPLIAALIVLLMALGSALR